MTSMREEILDALATGRGLTDRELTDRIIGQSSHPSQTNQACRALAGRGEIIRQQGSGGHIINSLPGSARKPPLMPPQALTLAATDRFHGTPGAPFKPGHPTNPGLSEDQIKEFLVQWLNADGWTVTVAWGKARGVDIAAHTGDRRWLIEVKGSGSLQPMRVNYFLAILGETLQRMDDPSARYSIALPDIVQFRGLWDRLPVLAKQRTGISALFVSRDGNVSHSSEAAS